MVRAVVGGRPFDFSKERIERRMEGVVSETIREHVVEIADRAFPPKQVLAVVTGWDRTSFTTMEAVRVLARAGFVCRRAGEDGEGRLAWIPEQPTDNETEVIADAETADGRLVRLELALAVAQEAIASLIHRVEKLEASGR